MIEHIDHDDDPADTAARAWVIRTKVGRATRILASREPEKALIRAFRAGVLSRPKPVDSDQTLPCPFCGKLPEEYEVGCGGIRKQKMNRCMTSGCPLKWIPFRRSQWQTRADLGTKGPDDEPD